MKENKVKIGMNLSHPGAFIKTKVFGQLGLSITKAAEVLQGSETG